jgi:hypothetical protein
MGDVDAFKGVWGGINRGTADGADNCETSGCLISGCLDCMMLRRPSCAAVREYEVEVPGGKPARDGDDGSDWICYEVQM